ncbi:MAG: ABC transporter permease [Sulfolobales archaeon]
MTAVSLPRYAAARALQTLVSFFILISIAFFLFRAMPGDPTAFLLESPRIHPQTRELLKQRLGLDRPLYEQFFVYIANVLTGELGYSLYYGRPVTEIMFGRRMINTLVLVGSSTFAAIALGLLMALTSVRKYGSKLDSSLTTFSLVTYSIPTFWLGMIFIMLFSVNLRLFPVGGTITATRVHEGFLDLALDYLWHMVLPFTVLTLIQIGYNYLIVRNSMLSLIQEDFVYVARAKGLSEDAVIRRHVFRAAIPPFATIVGLQLAGVFTGAVMTETVFSWEGLGRLMYEAVSTRDYPLLQGFFILILAAFLVTNYLVDLLYAYLDPRVRLK